MCTKKYHTFHFFYVGGQTEKLSVSEKDYALVTEALRNPSKYGTTQVDVGDALYIINPKNVARVKIITEEII